MPVNYFNASVHNYINHLNEIVVWVTWWGDINTIKRIISISIRVYIDLYTTFDTIMTPHVMHLPRLL